MRDHIQEMKFVKNQARRIKTTESDDDLDLDISFDFEKERPEDKPVQDYETQ